MHIKEVFENKYLLVCKYCEPLSDPEVQAEINNICKTFQIEIKRICPIICRKCYDKQTEEFNNNN